MLYSATFAQQDLCPRTFYTKQLQLKVLTSEACCIALRFFHERICTWNTFFKIFTSENISSILHQEPLHESPITPETLCIRGTLQQKLFTPKNICQQKLFTPNNFATNKIREQTPNMKQPLHRKAWKARTIFFLTALISPHRMSESFYTKKLLDQNHTHTQEPLTEIFVNPGSTCINRFRSWKFCIKRFLRPATNNFYIKQLQQKTLSLPTFTTNVFAPAG